MAMDVACWQRQTTPMSFMGRLIEGLDLVGPGLRRRSRSLLSLAVAAALAFSPAARASLAEYAEARGEAVSDSVIQSLEGLQPTITAPDARAGRSASPADSHRISADAPGKRGRQDRAPHRR